MKYALGFVCMFTIFLMWATTAVNYFTLADQTHSLKTLSLGCLNGIIASAFLWWTIDSVIDYVKARKEKEKNI